MTTTPPSGGPRECALTGGRTLTTAASAALAKALLCSVNPLWRHTAEGGAKPPLIRASCLKGRAEPSRAVPSEQAWKRGWCVLQQQQQPDPGLCISDRQVSPYFLHPRGLSSVFTALFLIADWSEIQSGAAEGTEGDIKSHESSLHLFCSKFNEITM